MIKLYDLVFEDIEKNNIDLGDKTQEFNEKLELMNPKEQKILINLVKGLNDTEKKELGSLINKYPDIKDLEPPKTQLEKKIALLQIQRLIGPGEILFHLELQDSSMVGDTNHDLMVKGKVWEVKKVEKDKGKFTTGKKGKITKFKFSRKLYVMITYLDKVIAALPKLKEDFEEISPELLDALELWQEKVATAYTPTEAILQGEQSKKFQKRLIYLINTIKKEIEVNTDDEFTTVKFGGVNVTPKDKGIDPVNIQRVDDDSVILNFIGKDTLKVLEILNELPYAREGDFDTDLGDAATELIKTMPSMIIFSLFGQMLVLDKDELINYLEFDSISQNEMRLRVKEKIWKAL